MWILIPLALIVIILLFGPVVTGLLMLCAALGAGVIATFALVLFGLFCFLLVAGAAGWMIWWLFDREGAVQALHEAERRRERR